MCQMIPCLVSAHPYQLPSGPIGGWRILLRLWCQGCKSSPPGAWSDSWQVTATTPPAGSGENVPTSVILTLLPIGWYVYDSQGNGNDQNGCHYTAGQCDASDGACTDHGGHRDTCGGEGGNSVMPTQMRLFVANRWGTGHGVPHRNQPQHCQGGGWRLCCRSCCSQ